MTHDTENLVHYEPSRYWEGLLGGDFTEAGVAYPDLARSFNKGIYSTQRRAVARALASRGFHSPPQKVLDVGSGIGVWIDFWSRRGVEQVFGVDLTAIAVERLRDRWPQHAFDRVDVGDEKVNLPSGCNVVSAMNVLLHITHDQRFARAVANLGASLAPDGILVLLEPVVLQRSWEKPSAAASHSRTRLLSDYVKVFEQADLQLVTVEPATVLLGRPFEARTRLGFLLYRNYWKAISRLVARREAVGATLAPPLVLADAALRRVFRHGPSTKVLIARRGR